MKAYRVMDQGPVEARAAAVLKAIMADYILVTDDQGLTRLMSPEDDYSVIIPADVMRFLIDEDLIELTNTIQ